MMPNVAWASQITRHAKTRPTDRRKPTSTTLDGKVFLFFFFFYVFLSQNRTEPGASSQPPAPVETPGSVNLRSIYLL